MITNHNVSEQRNKSAKCCHKEVMIITVKAERGTEFLRTRTNISLVL